ncbi:MAG: hypothetical protein IPH22_12890 [Nitrosomonas sp.]|nr:hypothetical protein [Nitrosomonas sp.]
MKDWLHHLHPFKTAEARRLAILFAIVYFAQGMSALPIQVIAISFKDHGLEADDVATFFLLASIPWFINRPLKNYLRCRCGVKNRLKMLIYYA